MGYCIDIEHKGLNKFRRITGSDSYVVEQKAAAQMRLWEDVWERKSAKESEQERCLYVGEVALNKTKKAQEALEEIEKTLVHTLDIDDAVDWETLKVSFVFEKSGPVMAPFPLKPSEYDSKYKPPSLWDKIFGLGTMLPTPEELKKCFKKDIQEWKVKVSKIEEKHRKDVLLWLQEKQDFLKKCEKSNNAIEKQKQKYFEKEAGAVVDYCDLVLTNSQYPDSFPQEFELDYNSQNKILIVEYQLPDIVNLPTLKEVKYIKSRDELKETRLSDSALNKMYDDVLYKITLRSLHEIFEADVIEAIDCIVFNGWVKSIDKRTGKEVSGCILSIQVIRKEFLDINLAMVDPKSCFKNLKGVGSSKLHGLAPVRPILQINKEDKRFTSSYDVAGELDESDNIAAMPWEDFEHLIRELFEKEFSQSGGEVKVTQASRDGGVDAIAFDPDPIRGGKIVIQAKRYTNTVGVSAVRDLYGTVINEGATKGILISTAEYGPDSYEFSKGKPLTLLNGSNLLHLLEKHGHKAKIDLKEAKKILLDRENN